MSYRIRFTLPDGRTGLWAHDYATREEAQQAINDRLPDTGLDYAVEEVATPEARIRELEAELAQLRDALAVVEALGDAMHRAMTTAQAYLAGEWGGVKVAMAEWAAYKEQLAASRQGPAKASEAPREGGDSGEWKWTGSRRHPKAKGHLDRVRIGFRRWRFGVGQGAFENKGEMEVHALWMAACEGYRIAHGVTEPALEDERGHDSGEGEK